MSDTTTFCNDDCTIGTATGAATGTATTGAGVAELPTVNLTSSLPLLQLLTELLSYSR